MICQIPSIPEDHFFFHHFEIHVSNQMNQKYKIWPALLVFHFVWVRQVSPKNILEICPELQRVRD